MAQERNEQAAHVAALLLKYRTQLYAYWYGTGNEIISMNPAREKDRERRLELHDRQVRKVLKALRVVCAKWKGMGTASERPAPDLAN